jgi:hypothetical protein
LNISLVFSALALTWLVGLTGCTAPGATLLEVRSLGYQRPLPRLLVFSALRDHADGGPEYRAAQAAAFRQAAARCGTLAQVQVSQLDTTPGPFPDGAEPDARLVISQLLDPMVSYNGGAPRRLGGTYLATLTDLRSGRDVWKGRFALRLGGTAENVVLPQRVAGLLFGRMSQDGVLRGCDADADVG